MPESISIQSLSHVYSHEQSHRNRILTYSYHKSHCPGSHQASWVFPHIREFYSKKNRAEASKSEEIFFKGNDSSRGTPALCRNQCPVLA